MKAVFIERFGDNSVVKYGDRADPQPGSSELLVRVHAASVNPVDFKIREGKLNSLIRFSLPLILGNDLSGEVIAVGPGVTRFQPGDAIFARIDKQRIGTFAELAVVAEAHAARKPSNLSHAEAASVPLVGLTSWQALVDIGGVTTGSKVLIHAGSGGVGSLAIQIAKHLGAQVATTTSTRHEALVRSLGADVVVDYRKARFEQQLSGYDFVLDTLGGDTLLRSFHVLKRGGRIVSIASLPDAAFARRWGMPAYMVWLLAVLGWKVSRAARRAGAHFEYLFMRPDGAQLGHLGELIERGALKPLVGRTFPLEQAAEALAFVESGRAEGKVVIEVVPGSATRRTAPAAATESSRQASSKMPPIEAEGAACT
jgi:NADPH:quinone reductase-like Zn-dependent oxidoreductase